MGVSAESFEGLRGIWGGKMGREWDAALRGFWRMRDLVCGVRRRSEVLRRRCVPGWLKGGDQLLEFLDSKKGGFEDEEEGGSERKVERRVDEWRKGLRILPPRPPSATRPKRRRRSGDPVFPPALPVKGRRTGGLPLSLPPEDGWEGMWRPGGGGDVLESEDLARARALYREATPEVFDEEDLDELVPDSRLGDQDNEEDADGSDDDDDEDHWPLAKLQDKVRAKSERRRDSGGGSLAAAGGDVGEFIIRNDEEIQKKEKEGTAPTPSSSSSLTEMANLFDLPPRRPSSISPLLPPLPLPTPRPAPSQLPFPPPSLLPPPSPRPQSLALPPGGVELQRKRKFRVIDLDADPALDEDEDDESEDDMDQVEGEDGMDVDVDED